MPSPIRLLHLEDSPRDAELILDWLKADGLDCEIILVGNRQAYESALEQGGFDAILCDNNLPDYDGRSALAQARAKQPATPFIFISGTLDEEVAVEYLKTGATDYILKEHLIRLGAAVRRALADAAKAAELKRAEEAMWESESKYRQLVEGLSDAAFLADEQNGRILDVNPQAALLLGRTRKEILGTKIEAVHTQETSAAFRQWLQTMKEPGRAPNWDGEIVRADGKGVPVRVTASPLTFHHRLLALFLYSDRTELKQIEAELQRRKSQELVERANGSLRILHLEDNPCDAEIVADLLAAGGGRYEMVRAENRKQFEEALEQPGFDLILCDFSLPDIDGFSALKMAGEKYPETPVIIISGVIDPSDAVECLKAGAADYLFKERLNRLPSAVQNALAAAAEHRQRIQAEQKLAASESRLRAIFETEPECVSLLAPDCTILEMNPAGLRMIEADSIEQVAGRSMHDMALPEYRAAFSDMAEYVLRGESAALEFEIQGMKGGHRWLETKAVPMRDEQGRVVSLLSVSRDITERKHAGEALRASEERFRELFDHSPDAIFVESQEGIVLDVNEAACQLHGMTHAQLVGRNVLDLVPASEREKVARNFSKLTTGEITKVEGSSWTADGRTVPVEITSKQIVFSGQPSVLLHVRDITARKQAEAALKLSEFSVQHASLPTIWVARDARILRVNRAACDLLGYTEAELLSKSITDINPDLPAERWPAHWQELRGRQRMCFETHQRHKDGRIIPVEVDLNWFEFGGREYDFAFVRDLTERHKQERLAQRSQRMESIGTLAGGIAHDLNNALAPIMMSGELLKMAYPAESKILNAIEASARHAADMVRQLLAFAKGAEGERVPVQPRRLIRELENLMKGSFPKNIRLVIQCDPQLPTVLGDATQLHQVLLNLCVNARDAMPGGGTLKLEATSKEVDASYASSMPDARPGKYVMLRVRDTGTGIPPEILDRIFDPFFTTKDPDRGTGLGLSTVMGIVKGHGGFLHVYSQPGQGSTFAAYLPVDPAGSEVKPTSVTPEIFRGHGETILFVDDEAVVRSVARAVLQLLNFSPLIATDGTDALMLAAQHRTEIRAIITDLHMPRMDGLAFVREVRRLLPDIPIAVASGFMEDDVAAEFKALGTTGRLDKPFTQAQLSETLKNLLAPK